MSCVGLEKEAIIIINFLMRNRHVKIIESIKSIDEDLEIHGININHRKHFLTAFVSTILYFMIVNITLCWVIVLKLATTNDNNKYYWIINLFAAYSFNSFLNNCISHMLITGSIYKRFQLPQFTDFGGIEMISSMLAKNSKRQKPFEEL
ncbi:CLUMA_CG017731, isoform A [Clunio marinus]|uniref:CLUMA_CG017731, isoform A n=1 Tax=Clunio marinus TaxID=568069 RepID=A0A1J1IWK5_9DIPT|nr:CLUMA_CG017731, isoform A [Clunio marinus]